jgi:hypothetical protein
MGYPLLMQLPLSAIGVKGTSTIVSKNSHYFYQKAPNIADNLG